MLVLASIIVHLCGTILLCVSLLQLHNKKLNTFIIVLGGKIYHSMTVDYDIYSVALIVLECTVQWNHSYWNPRFSANQTIEMIALLE